MLTPQNALTEIDRLIRTAWLTKRPVYLEMPRASRIWTCRRLGRPSVCSRHQSDPERLASAVRAITARLSVAAAPVILVDLDADRHDAASEIEALATRLGVSVATVATAKAVIDETHPWYLGTYSGAGSSPAVRQAVESSDCLLTVGYRRVDSASGFFTDTLPDNAIHARAYSVVHSMERTSRP